MNKISDSDLNIFFSKVISNDFKADNIKINVNRLMNTGHFNTLKEELKKYSEFYRVSNKQYKDGEAMYIFYKFYTKTNQEILITTIHEWGSPFIFVKSIEVKSFNKGE